jgi:gluconate kinase
MTATQIQNIRDLARVYHNNPTSKNYVAMCEAGHELVEANDDTKLEIVMTLYDQMYRVAASGANLIAKCSNLKTECIRLRDEFRVNYFTMMVIYDVFDQSLVLACLKTVTHFDNGRFEKMKRLSIDIDLLVCFSN